MVQKNQENKQYVGVDVAKLHLDIHIHPAGFSCKIENNVESIELFAKEVLSKYCVESISCEATGGYENDLIEILETKWSVNRANPLSVKNFARILGRRAKTDSIDAKILAQYGEFMKNKYVKTTTYKANAKLVNMVIRLDQLASISHSEKCRIAKKTDEIIAESLQSVIKLVDEEMKNLQLQIDKLIDECEKTSEIKEILCSFKGIGDKSAAKLIAFMPEIGHLNKRQIASLAGLAPYNRDSGTMNGKRFIQAGRKSVRNALYMVAMVAMQHNEVIKNFYKKLIENGKVFKVAITAVMRKIIVILNTMVKLKQKWKFS